jgi:hypothetical protein
MKTLKLFTLILCLAAFSFTNQSEAQVDLTINPVGLLWGDLSVGADFTISENLSVEAAVGFGSGNNGLGEGEFKHRSIPITAFGKYYFNPDNGADKFYILAFLRFINRNYSWEGSSSFYDDYSVTRVGGGFGVGYKVVSGGGFVFDINFGAGRSFINNYKYDDSSVNDPYIDWGNIMFAGKLGIGYRFGGK